MIAPTPWWALTVGLALTALWLLYLLPRVFFWPEEGSARLLFLHWARDGCAPARKPNGGYRCKCGRTGAGLDDFPGWQDFRGIRPRRGDGGPR